MYVARKGGGAGPIVLVPGGLFWTRRRAGAGFWWVVPDTHDYFLTRPGRLSSKSGADMIISCGDQRLVGSHRKVSHSRGLGPATRWGGVPKVAPELLPWPVGVLVVATMGGFPKVRVVFQKVVPESPRLDGVVFQKLGWCSKKLSQNPHSVYNWCITNKKIAERKWPVVQLFWICRRTANRVVIGGLTHKQSSNVSRAFPPENQILHAFVRIYQLYLRLSTVVLLCFVYVCYGHDGCTKLFSTHFLFCKDDTMYLRINAF